MVSLQQLRTALSSERSYSAEYQCQRDLDLYKTPQQESLVTQAAAGCHLRVTTIPDEEDLQALWVCLCEDDYPGWLAIADLAALVLAPEPYQAPVLARSQIEARLPGAIAFAEAAMAQPHEYLWGGTVGPSYDCSGLMQAAFRSVGVQLPRDAYQQEAFTQAIALEAVQPGDLVFFGPPEKATHVGLCLGDGRYLHSSGKDMGRNGIGINRFGQTGDPVGDRYWEQLRGFGRVVTSYQPRAMC